MSKNPRFFIGVTLWKFSKNAVFFFGASWGPNLGSGFWRPKIWAPLQNLGEAQKNQRKKFCKVKITTDWSGSARNSISMLDFQLYYREKSFWNMKKIWVQSVKKRPKWKLSAHKWGGCVFVRQSVVRRTSSWWHIFCGVPVSRPAKPA